MVMLTVAEVLSRNMCLLMPLNLTDATVTKPLMDWKANPHQNTAKTHRDRQIYKKDTHM